MDSRKVAETADNLHISVSFAFISAFSVFSVLSFSPERELRVSFRQSRRISHLIAILTVFAVCESTLRMTSTSPRPASTLGSCIVLI